MDKQNQALTAAELARAAVIFAPLVWKIVQQLRHRGDDLTEAEILAAFHAHIAAGLQTGRDALTALDAEDAG